MPTIDVPKLVEDTLIGVFTDQTGETPEGSFIPDQKTLHKINTAFGGDLHGLCKWLKLAAYAHIARTQITKTPFFINSVLFAESSLAFMEKHEKWLLNHYASGGVPAAFKNSVYRDVAWVEEEFVTSCLLWSKSPEEVTEKLSLMRPTVWWAVLAYDMRRISHSPFTFKTTHDGVKGDFRELFTAEIGKLKEDSGRHDRAKKVALRAIRDVRIKIATRYRVATPMYVDNQIDVTPNSLMSGRDITPYDPMLESDALFAKELAFLSPYTPTTKRPIERPAVDVPTLAQLRAVSEHEDE